MSVEFTAKKKKKMFSLFHLGFPGRISTYLLDSKTIFTKLPLLKEGG